MPDVSSRTLRGRADGGSSRRGRQPKAGVLRTCANAVGRVVLGQFAARPITTLASAALAALMLGIAMNALLLQRSRHPAPLFAGSEKPAAPSTVTEAPADAEDDASPPQKHAHPAGKDAISHFLKSEPAQHPPAMPVKTVHRPDGPAGDTIGDYIKTKLATPVLSEKAILAAQRQLTKLGYSLKPTGLLGPNTRAAITRFEHDHKMSESGDLTPRIQRALASASQDSE